VSNAGGYSAALKNGPFPANRTLKELSEEPEDSLDGVEDLFTHTAFRILSPDQVERDLELLRQQQRVLPSFLKNQKPDNYIAVFSSLWSKKPGILPIQWEEQAVLVLSSGEEIVPAGWLPVGEITEKDSTGSIVGLLYFKRPEMYSSTFSLKLMGIPDGRTCQVRLKSN
jgi:hypothetical protein